MPDLDYVLYDTAAFGNAANTEFILFQVAQGGDSTHTEAFTNSRGAGSLPNQEEFTVEEIHAIVDYNTVLADIPKIHLASFAELRVGDLTVFKAPLALLMSRNDYGGHYSQAAAADEAAIGLVGNGYKLTRPIVIPGGTAFRVRVLQGTALAAGSSNIKFALRGILSLPD